MLLLYGTLLCAYYIFDTSMAQKSRFKMQQQGEVTKRNAFPQLPWSMVEDPKFIQTSHGNKLLIDGWWAYVRKPVSRPASCRLVPRPDGLCGTTPPTLRRA